MRGSGFSVVIVSFLIAYLAAIFPLPEWLTGMRPHWVAMMVIFWVMALPERVGVWLAWSAGLFLDSLYGVNFGIYAMSLATVAYMTYAMHAQIRVRSRPEQAIFVFIVLLIFQFELYFIQTAVGLDVNAGVAYWTPVLISGILWVWFAPLMQALKLRFNVR